MPSREPLTQEAIRQALDGLDGWTFEDDRLVKTFTFGGFPEAVSFIVRLAFHAEALDHHPDLRNVYDRVEIALSTHDAGDRVTEMDVTLARTIDAFAWT